MSGIAGYLYSFIILLRHVFESELSRLPSILITKVPHFSLYGLFFLWIKKKQPMLLNENTHLPHIQTLFQLQRWKKHVVCLKTFLIIIKRARMANWDSGLSAGLEEEVSVNINGPWMLMISFDFLCHSLWHL